jgi:hypothetical protein
LARNKREYIKCSRCPKTVRTRKQYVIETGVCTDCTWNNVRKGLPITEENSHELHWMCMREEWFHELLYRQVEQNGFIALGLGRLEFLREKQRSDKTKGKYQSTQNGYTNEYDMRLQTKGGTQVIVEIKKVFTEDGVAQALRYSRTVKDEGHRDPEVVLIAVEFPERTMASVRELRSLGWHVRAFFITASPRGFKLVEIGDEYGGKKAAKEAA